MSDSASITKWKSSGCFEKLNRYEQHQLAQLLENQEKHVSSDQMGMDEVTVASVEKMSLPVAARAYHNLAIRSLVSVQVPGSTIARMIVDDLSGKREEKIPTSTYKTDVEWMVPRVADYQEREFPRNILEAQLVRTMGDKVADYVSGFVLNDLYSLANLEFVSNGAPEDLIEAFRRSSVEMYRTCRRHPNWIAGDFNLMVDLAFHDKHSFDLTIPNNGEDLNNRTQIKVRGKFGKYKFCHVPDAPGFIMGYKGEGNEVESGYFLMPYLLSAPVTSSPDETDKKVRIACRIGKKIVVEGGNFYTRIIVKK